MPVTPQPLELNPLKEMAQVNKIDYSVDFDNLYLRMDDFDKLFKNWQLHSTETKRKYADDSYRNRKVIEFNVQLTANQYTNFQNVRLCFPMKIKLVADNDNDITAGIIPVNNLFTHWIKEIDIKKYDDDMPILPLPNTVDIYRYSDELLKTYVERCVKNNRK